MYLNGILLGGLFYFVIHYFSINLNNVNNLWELVTVGPNSRINFTLEDFNFFLNYAISFSIWLGVISLTYVATQTFLQCFLPSSKFNRETLLSSRLLKMINTLIAVIVCVTVLAISVVPLAELDTSNRYMKRIPVSLRRWYDTAQDHGFMSSYGLFRVMTGDGGRSELIIEGTNNPQNEPWQQYHFRYKPGDELRAPRFNGEYIFWLVPI